jgi:hypothetical protein
MNGKNKKHEFEPSVAQNGIQEEVTTEPEAIDVGKILGAKPQKLPIDKDAVLKATETLKKYKEGKANLERKIIENEQWYKLRHWEQMRNSKEQEVQPISAWLFNCIANKHADAMDNFPAPNVLPREEGDKADAQMLSSIIPVILDQNDFEKTYSDVWNYKLKTGTGVYSVLWDSSKLNGLGDIAVQKVDLINLFWESGITDIQKSRNVFHVELCDNDILVGAYPQLSGKLSNSSIDLGKYAYDDAVDTTNKSAVVDWYYKKNVGGRTVLHYVKYVNDEVLYASENDPMYAERGFYDHAKYPFVFDVLFPVEGTPTGFGYIDIGKDVQQYIDRLKQAVLKNALINANPRWFIREDGSVNKDEYADLNNAFIHVNGNLGQDSIIPIQATGLSSIYVEILNNEIEELKETTGNRDVSTGGTGGVTAASAIAAMQEAGSKLSRDANKQSYRAFRELTLFIVELIRQFYDEERSFRIMGNNGVEQFIAYSNQGIAPQAQGVEFGVDMGYRIPLFDIEISAQKQSPYSKMAQNEMALQFFGAGFFNPQIADQALACLDMMDFDRKEFVMQKVSQNGGMFQKMMMMQQQMLGMAMELDSLKSTNFAQAMAKQMGASLPPMAMGGSAAENVDETEALGGNEGSESSVTQNARKRVAESTSPT